MTATPEKWTIEKKKEGYVAFKMTKEGRIDLQEEFLDIPTSLFEQLQSEAYEKGHREGVQLASFYDEREKKEIEEARADERKVIQQKIDLVLLKVVDEKMSFTDAISKLNHLTLEQPVSSSQSGGEEKRMRICVICNKPMRNSWSQLSDGRYAHRHCQIEPFSGVVR